MRVQIDSRFPINMSVDAREFGKHFANLNSEEQAAVLRAIIEEMEAFPTQWDYIAIEFDDPKNADIRHKLKRITSNLLGSAQ